MNFVFVIIASAAFGVLWSSIYAGFGMVPTDGVVAFLIWFVPILGGGFCIGKYGALATQRDRDR